MKEQIAVGASKALEGARNLPGNIVRAPGFAILAIRIGLYEIGEIYKKSRAEVKAARREAKHNLKLAKAQLKETKAACRQLIRKEKVMVKTVRKVGQSRVQLAAEKTGETESTLKFYRERRKVEERIEKLEEEVRYYTFLIHGFSEEEASKQVEVEEPQPKAEQVEEPILEVLVPEEPEPQKGTTTEALHESGSREHHPASETADAPEVEVGAGVPLTDNGQDKEL